MSTQPKITIQGAPRDFDPAELSRRQEVSTYAYRNTSQRCEILTKPIAFQLLEAVAEKVNNGFQLASEYPILTNPLHFSCYLIKPDSMQQEDLSRICAEVKDKYIQELEQERAEYKARLIQQLLEAEVAKEQKKMEDQKKKRRTELEKEASECFGELIIPE